MPEFKNNYQSTEFPERHNLKISINCPVITSYHKILDSGREGHLTSTKIGTTGKGISPTYVDKFNRRGIRGIDLLNYSTLSEKLLRRLEQAIINKEIPNKIKSKLEQEIINCEKCKRLVSFRYLLFFILQDSFITTISACIEAFLIKLTKL